ISRAATRLQRRRGLSRQWLAQATGPRPVPGRSSPELANAPEQTHVAGGPHSAGRSESLKKSDALTTFSPLTPALSMNGRPTNRLTPPPGPLPVEGRGRHAGVVVLGLNARMVRRILSPLRGLRGKGEATAPSALHAPRFTLHVPTLLLIL